MMYSTGVSFPEFPPNIWKTKNIFEKFQMYIKEDRLVEWNPLPPLLYMYPLPIFSNYLPMSLFDWQMFNTFFALGAVLVARAIEEDLT